MAEVGIDVALDETVDDQAQGLGRLEQRG
nr:hypothetical protein [Tanacetum cinerariifolium]